MGLLENFDTWLLKDAYSPTLIIVGLGGLFGLWVVLPIARFWRDKLFQAKRREFFDEFLSIEQTANRQRFRWNLDRAYRKHQSDAKSGDLPNLIRNIEWPDNFPPNQSILEYSNTISWPNENGKIFWNFCTILFDPVLSISDRSKILEEPFYSDLLNGRLATSKFWDDWARTIVEGLLSSKDIIGPLETNFCDIRALAIVELALAKSIKWDQSKGKQALFLLAKKHLQIDSDRSRIRKWMAGKLRKITEWVS